MIRLRGTVAYEGGQEDRYETGTAVLVAWEAYARRHGLEAYGPGNVQTMLHFVAYTALGIREGFDVWLRSVDGVTPDDEEPTEPVPPTLEGVSVE